MGVGSYSFEDWTLERARNQLARLGSPVVLRPKSLEVLRVLIERAGTLQSRDDLLDAAWPGVVVTEDSLTQCISEIRGVLGEAGPRFIKTVPKRGYIFTAKVTHDAVVEPASLVDVSQIRKFDVLAPLSAAGRAEPVICVLPLANLSGDSAQEYLGDGLTEDLINALSHFHDLSVIARSSSFSYKGRAVDVREIGRQLGADYVVDGSVRRNGERIRITAQLVDARTGVQRWSDRFDRNVGDIFAIQDEITQEIVRIVMAHLARAESERAARKPANTWTAYDLLIRGEQVIQLLEQGWRSEFTYEARRLFVEAQRTDPTSARICANLGHTFSRAYGDPWLDELGNPEVLQQGFDLLSKAVSLDPNLPHARVLLGWALFWRDAEAGVREYETALALNPNYWCWRFSNVVSYAGQPARALDLVKAQLRLDPFHPPIVYAYQGHALFLLERYEEAVSPLRECIRRAPNMLLAPVWLAATLVRLNKTEEALAIVTDLRRRAPRMTLDRWHAPKCYTRREQMQNMVEALQEASFQ